MLDMHKHHTLYCVHWAYCINPSRVSIGATIKYWLIEIGHRRVVTADNPLLWVPGPGPPHIKGRADLNIGREFETLGRATKYSKSTGGSKDFKKNSYGTWSQTTPYQMPSRFRLLTNIPIVSNNKQTNYILFKRPTANCIEKTWDKQGVGLGELPEKKAVQVGILSQPAWPPLPSPNVGIPTKGKTCFFLHFRLF